MSVEARETASDLFLEMQDELCGAFDDDTLHEATAVFAALAISLHAKAWIDAHPTASEEGFGAEITRIMAVGLRSTADEQLPKRVG